MFLCTFCYETTIGQKHINASNPNCFTTRLSKSTNLIRETPNLNHLFSKYGTI